MYKLWLDDVRPAPPGYIHFYDVRTLIAFCEKNGLSKIQEISLDHDLGDHTETGYEFLVWLEEKVSGTVLTHLPHLKIHSANPVGRKNMEAAIRSIERFWR